MIKTARQLKDLISNQAVSKIMDEAEYPGIRVSMETEFDGVVTPLKIDISTGDVITPARFGIASS